MRSGVTVAPKSTGNKPVTGAERQSLAYYNRAREAVDGIEELENRIAKRSYASQEFNTRAPNVLKSEDQQVYDQRQRAFTEARLRKESGAAIPESEFANDRRTYWALPGTVRRPSSRSGNPGRRCSTALATVRERHTRSITGSLGQRARANPHRARKRTPPRPSTVPAGAKWNPRLVAGYLMPEWDENGKQVSTKVTEWDENGNPISFGLRYDGLGIWSFY